MAALPSGKAIVVLTVDLREQTLIRDVPHVGDVFFRKFDETYPRRAKDDYDFGVVGSVAADWRATFGKADDNRAPRVFAIDPGTYVIEKIKIGSTATAIGPGYDPRRGRARFGSFTVRAGDIVNLGRLVIYMEWFDGYFAARIEDNSAAIHEFLSQTNPALDAAVQTTLLSVVPKIAFETGNGRF